MTSISGTNATTNASVSIERFGEYRSVDVDARFADAKRRAEKFARDVLPQSTPDRPADGPVRSTRKPLSRSWRDAPAYLLQPRHMRLG
jgi:hypothetical protein